MISFLGGRGPRSICIINEGLQPQLRVPDATPATPAEVEEVKERDGGGGLEQTSSGEGALKIALETNRGAI